MIPTKAEAKIMRQHCDAWLKLHERKPKTAQEWAECGAAYIEAQAQQLATDTANLVHIAQGRLGA